MPEKIFAPFTDEQIELLNRYQKNVAVHPYTCGSGNRKDEKHLDGEGVLVAVREGLKCLFCDYRQDWALDGSLQLADYDPTKALKARMKQKV